MNQIELFNDISYLYNEKFFKINKGLKKKIKQIIKNWYRL